MADTHRRTRALARLAGAGALTAALGGCTTFDSTLGMGDLVAAAPSTGVDPFVTSAVSATPVERLAPSGGYNYALIYGSSTVDGKPIPAVDYERVGYEHLRRKVAWGGPERPGDIVIDTGGRYLYLVQPGGSAIRYGIAVGREGFGWTGREKLSWKREWPTWTPPESMIEREPDLARWRDGMPGGADNPLGARALYLGNTLYRIHGTNKPYSIGKAASSGCFRMINQDVLDLYQRVQPGATVHVRSSVPPEVAFN